MKFEKYIQSLLPTFGKDRVLEDCRVTRTEIKDVTLPLYDTAVPLFKGYKFKSGDVQEQIASFNRLCHPGSDNIITHIQKALKASLENLDEVEALVEKTYNEEVAGSGLTYLKANLLQFTECLNFVSRYARRYLLWIYVAETAQIPDSETDLSEAMAPAEIEWIKINFIPFCTALNVVSIPTTKVKKALNDIPDIVVTEENVRSLSATMGENKLDPFEVRLIPVWLNPIYHIRMFVAEWQANRYKAALEERKLIELRHLNLKKRQEGKPDARLQKEIAYTEQRLRNINFKISKMEKDYE